MLHQATHELVAREGFVHKGKQVNAGEVLGTITAHRPDFPSDQLINRTYNGKLEMRRVSTRSEPKQSDTDAGQERTTRRETRRGESKSE